MIIKWKHYFNGKKLNFMHYFILLIILPNIINCIIEVPIEIINIKSQNFHKNSPKIFIENGVTKINSQNLFLANIKIGSKSQVFRLILDTGSSLTWVADAENQIDNFPKEANLFDPKSSTSCIMIYQSFNINYGTGSCSGYYYKDKIKYINNKEFELKFGVVKNAKFDFSEADGIIGLSRTSHDKSTSFIHMIYESKIIDSQSFSFKFASNNLYLPMGKLFIGKHEDFSKKDAFNCSLLDDNFGDSYYWTCKLKSFGLENNGERIVSSQSISIIFDTGTNFIFLPYKYLNDMEKDLNKVGCNIAKYDELDKEMSFDKFQNQYRLVCSSNDLPQFLFVIGNTTFTLPSSLTFYINGNHAYSYILFIKKGNDINPYIFGTPFFMSFHTLFNDEEKKLEFYPLDKKYIINNEPNDNLKYAFIIISLILLWIILFYMIYLFIKWKKENSSDDYQSILPNDINIELSNK